MVLDNSELVATEGSPTGQEVITVTGAIGGGVGASLAITSGTVTGAALVPVLVAGFAGVGATAVASWTIGKAIGETDLVRDSLVSLMESLVPINDGQEKNAGNIVEKNTVECSWAPGEKFTANFGGTTIEVSFYVDALGQEGFSTDLDFNAGLEFFSDPYQAFEAAQAIEIIGTPDYWLNGCGSGAVLP